MPRSHRALRWLWELRDTVVPTMLPVARDLQVRLVGRFAANAPEPNGLIAHVSDERWVGAYSPEAVRCATRPYRPPPGEVCGVRAGAADT